MACGLCVVGYDQGGISDLAQNGQEALFCATGDEVAFRNLLVQCLREPGLPQVIGQRAQQLASHYPWDRNASQTEQFCLRLMHNRKT
jgi:glycosyltransferase involved in cell wall biosynthesis